MIIVDAILVASHLHAAVPQAGDPLTLRLVRQAIRAAHATRRCAGVGGGRNTNRYREHTRGTKHVRPGSTPGEAQHALCERGASRASPSWPLPWCDGEHAGDPVRWGGGRPQHE